MKIYPILSLAVASLLPAALQADYSTSFTTADGFTNGNLSGQNSWNANTTGASVFTVADAVTTGTVAIGQVTGTATISYNGEGYDFSQVGANYTLSADLQFTDAGDTTASNNPFFSMMYGFAPTGGTDGSTSLVLRKTSSEAYQIALYSKTAVTLSKSALGLDPGVDNDSDVLRLTSSFTGGGSVKADWSVDYTLYNVTTATTIVSGTLSNINLNANSIDNPSMYGLVASGAFQQDNHDGISNIELLDYSASFTAIPEPGTYAFGFGGLMLAIAVYLRRRR